MLLLNASLDHDAFLRNLIHFFLLFRRFFRFFGHIFSRNHYRSLFHILFFTEIISITLNLILLIIWRILWTLSSSQYHRYFGLQESPSSALFNLNNIKIRAKDLQSSSCQACWMHSSLLFLLVLISLKLRPKRRSCPLGQIRTSATT